MSFFIAYFPFDFECAKLQHFLGMAMHFHYFFLYSFQIIKYQLIRQQKAL